MIKQFVTIGAMTKRSKSANNPSMSSHHFFITPPFHRDTSPPLAQPNAVVESLANSPVEGVSGSPPFMLVCLSGWLLSWGSQPLLAKRYTNHDTEMHRLFTRTKSRW